MAERSVEVAAEIQERLIRWRFECVDDCLERIDEHLRVLVERGGVGVDEVIAIYEAQEAILRRHKGRRLGGEATVTPQFGDQQGPTSGDPAEYV